jgi:hypothetical protein
MGDLIKFNYDGQAISFEFADGNRMINATEMAKPFGKPVGNFLRLDSSQNFIRVLEERYSHLNIGVKRPPPPPLRS